MTPDRLTATLPAATTLITAVREKDGPAIHRALFNAPLPALAITLAHLVPDDRSTSQLLAWTQPGAQYRRADGTDMRDDDGAPNPHDPGGRCGTLLGYARHLALGMDACVACNSAHRNAEKKRKRRINLHPLECGTLKGARQHQARKEPMCPECAAAWEATLRPHGTLAAARRHQDRAEDLCGLCADVYYKRKPDAAPKPRPTSKTAPCGTYQAIRRHRNRGEELCPECAGYLSKPRAARTGTPPNLAPCGTYSAARRHKRNNEPLDPPCELALNVYNTAYGRRRRQRETAA